MKLLSVTYGQAGKVVVKKVIFSVIETLITNIQGGLGRRIRRLYYKFRLAEMGENVVIDCGVRIVNPEWVRIGENTWIDNYVVILAGPPDRSCGAFCRKGEVPGLLEGEVHIGSDCHVAPFVVLQGHGGIRVGSSVTIASGSKIYSLSHHYRNANDKIDLRRFKFSSMAPKAEQSMISGPVIIGDAAAVGLNSILLPGAAIGDGAWISVGSIVKGGVAPKTLLTLQPRFTSTPID